jgi:hypothetical protein
MIPHVPFHDPRLAVADGGGGMWAAWHYDLRKVEQEKRATIANEQRLAELKAREMAGAMLSEPGEPGRRTRTNQAEPVHAPVSE